MHTATSTDGRVVFSVYEEDNFAGSVMLPNGILLKLPSRDLLVFYELLSRHIEGIKRETERFESRLPTNTPVSARTVWLDLEKQE